MGKVRNFYVRHPGADLVVALLAGAAAGIWESLLTPLPDELDIASLSSVLTSAAALVLAASTFACTMTYQSTTRLLLKVRSKFPDVLRKNWITLLTLTFAAVVAGLGSIIVESASRPAGFGLFVLALMLLAVSFSRTVYWIQYTLFADEADKADPFIDQPILAKSF